MCVQVQQDMLQSLVLLLLVARLLQKLSFQPYISVITTTLQRAAPDLAAFLSKHHADIAGCQLPASDVLPSKLLFPGKSSGCMYWRSSTDAVFYASAMGWANLPRNWCLYGSCYRYPLQCLSSFSLQLWLSTVITAAAHAFCHTLLMVSGTCWHFMAIKCMGIHPRSG
jgi:hypothetical protein